VSYYWQFEADPGSGVFEDIILLPAGDLAFQSADGTTFKVSPDLAGLSLRVKAIYQDGHGTTEVVFSQPTSVVAPGAPVVPTTPTPVVDATAGGEGLHMVRSDLNFILDQIKIAEADAAGQDILSLIPNIRAPLGLRAVDGSNNNLMNLNGINNTEFGAADNLFPRLTDPVFNPAEGVCRLLRTRLAGHPGRRTADQRPCLTRSRAPSVSAPFNSWFTLFGQFFDHGLDLVNKGGSGTVFIPLQPDDPLYVPGSPTNFMVLTRATVSPGPDGISARRTTCGRYQHHHVVRRPEPDLHLASVAPGLPAPIRAERRGGRPRSRPAS
jgi:hypothetical protein